MAPRRVLTDSPFDTLEKTFDLLVTGLNRDGYSPLLSLSKRDPKPLVLPMRVVPGSAGQLTGDRTSVARHQCPGGESVRPGPSGPGGP